MSVVRAPRGLFDWIVHGFDLPKKHSQDGKMDYSFMSKIDETPDAVFDVVHESGFISKWTASILWKDCTLRTSLYSKLKGPVEAFFPPGTRYTLIMWLGNSTRPTILRANKALEITVPSARCAVLLRNYPLIHLDSLYHIYDYDKMLKKKKLRIRIMLKIFDCDVVASGQGLGPKLGKLFNNPQYSDVTFRCGQQEIKAHRSILACQSQVFDAMFSADMMESTSGVVQVDDMDFSALSLILRYIYTNQVTELRPDMTLEVIYGAEKYGLEELKNICFAKLAECITDDNVGALAVAAHSYKAQTVVVKAIRDYVDRDFVHRVRTNPRFRQLVKQYPEAFYE